MNKKLIVWDFHGVLEIGTENAVYEISNYALQEFGYEARFSKELCDAQFGKKWYLYFKVLMPDLEEEKCIELQNFCSQYSEKNLHITEKHIKPNPKAHQILKSISDSGHKQILISNSHQNFLMPCLNFVGLEGAFEHIYANGNTKMKKLDALQFHLQQCGETFEEIIAVDDLPDNLSLKTIPSVKFCLYRHTPPFPECSADYFTHDLQEILTRVTYENNNIFVNAADSLAESRNYPSF